MTGQESGDLRLGHLFQAAGIDPGTVVILRHGPGSLADHNAEPYGESLRTYVSEQDRFIPKLSAATTWLNFLGSTPGRRARFLTAYTNQGELEERRNGGLRYFDLQPSSMFVAYAGRLEIEWTKDPVNWAKTGREAAEMQVIEIADPSTRPFHGYDSILIRFGDLEALTVDSQYSQWRTALSAVKGIYAIADTSTGKLYVGKADGAGGFLGRWSEYARTGHGGNAGLRELDEADLAHRNKFLFSILQAFSPNAPMVQIDAAEAHFKDALMTRRPFGLNWN